MVRDHKVVGSNPVASTINRRITSVVRLFIYRLSISGFEGRQAKLCFAQVCGLYCRLDSNRLLLSTVRAAQGANPVAYCEFKSRKAYAFGTTASTIYRRITSVVRLFIYRLSISGFDGKFFNKYG